MLVSPCDGDVDRDSAALSAEVAEDTCALALRTDTKPEPLHRARALRRRLGAVVHGPRLPEKASRQKTSVGLVKCPTKIRAWRFWRGDLPLPATRSRR